MRDVLLRMIDANLNRAREALRVMEDIARFGLDDAVVSGELKSIRHGLQAAAERLPWDRAQLLAHRDTEGDVGTTVKTARELARPDLASVAAAAGARLTEALRSLEEAAKVESVEAAAGFERLRYRAYTADQRLTAALGAFPRRRQWKLCVLITEALCRHHSWEEVARRALAGGADCLQLREKVLESRELVRRARVLVDLARGVGASVVVNDRPDVALLAGAHGVHIGQTDLAVEDVRKIAGARLVVGVSTDNVEQARAAVAAGADYCGVGPMFATATKEKPRLAGPAYLRAYVGDEVVGRVPHLAIGGVTLSNIGELVGAGVRGVAVSSVVCGAEDPEGVCRGLVGSMV